VIVPSNVPQQRVTRDRLCEIGTTSADMSAVEDGTVEGGTPISLGINGGVDGDRVWMMCSCGAVLVRVGTFS